jgi:hypothetical protein
VSHEYKGKERRHYVQLSDEQFEAIAERAKEIAKEEIYADIGKGIVKRFLWLLGLGGSTAIAYLTLHGYIK